MASTPPLVSSFTLPRPPVLSSGTAGERVAMLQDQLAATQLDNEQQRHAAIAEKAELEEGRRASDTPPPLS